MTYTYDLVNTFHVAVPTAFYQNEELNVSATMEHILYLQQQGVNSVLVCGSTGEQHSLTLTEKLSLLDALTKETRFSEDIEIIFGVASIRQKEAMKLAEEINQSSAISGVLLGFPPYIVPNQSEAKSYVEKIAGVLNKTVIIYNNPRRTGFDLSLEVVNDLFELKNVIGIKEAGDPKRVNQFKKPAGKPRYIYAGGESDLLNKVKHLGFDRLSSIGGNIYPLEVQNWFNDLLLSKNRSFEYQENLDELFATSAISALKKAITKKENIPMGIPRSPLGN